MCAPGDLDLLVAIEGVMNALGCVSAYDIDVGLKLDLIIEQDAEPRSIRSVYLNRVIGFFDEGGPSCLRLLFKSDRYVRALSCCRAGGLFFGTSG